MRRQNESQIDEYSEEWCGDLCFKILPLKWHEGAKQNHVTAEECQ